LKLCYRSSRIMPGVEAVKAMLRDVRGRTKLRISPKCRKLIADLSSYRWAPGREEPVKDGVSDHSLDALRYFFVNYSSREDGFEVHPRIGTITHG
ncbi:hypothetical protein KKH18_12960, partial [bacterium]|nr:hypothetical protein [bacterium]